MCLKYNKHLINAAAPLVFSPPFCLCIIVAVMIIILLYPTVKCWYCSRRGHRPFAFSADSLPLGNLFYTHNFNCPLFIDDSHSYISTWMSESTFKYNTYFMLSSPSVIPLPSVQKPRSTSRIADLHKWYHCSPGAWVRCLGVTLDLLLPHPMTASAPAPRVCSSYNDQTDS